MKRNILHDRFIPFKRPKSETELSTFLLYNSIRNNNQNPTYSEYIEQGLFSKTIGSHKMLSYREQNDISKSCYIKYLTNIKKESNSVKLDVNEYNIPDVVDDFYSNILDWITEKEVFICVSNTILKKRLDNNELMVYTETISTDDEFTCISSNKSDSIISIGTKNGFFGIIKDYNHYYQKSSVGYNSKITSITHNDNIMSIGSEHGDILHFDNRTKTNILSININDTICNMKWSKNNQQIAVGTNEGYLMIWDVRKLDIYDIKFDEKLHNGPIKAMDWHPKAHGLLATGGGFNDKNIIILNTKNGNKESIHTDNQNTSITWSYCGKEMAVSLGRYSNSLLNISYPALKKKTIYDHKSRILSMCLSPDGSSVATIASDNKLKVCKLFKTENVDDYQEPKFMSKLDIR